MVLFVSRITSTFYYLWDIIACLYLFLHPLTVADVRVLFATVAIKYLFPDRPQDDRDNTLDKLIHVIAKAPQDNILTKYVLGQFVQELWDGINKPFAVVPPPGVDAGNIPRNSKWRLPDGSGNSSRYPVVGMTNTKYNIIVRNITPIRKKLPSPEDVFELLMERDRFVPHPNGINVLMFYMATLITHDLFWSSTIDPTVNLASSYLDLQPLYGRSVDELRKIRTFSGGKIRQDFFTDVRISLQLPGVAVLLVLFSRNHNWIANNLMRINEGDKFNPDKYSAEYLDEKLFQTARLINGGCYLNLITHDYIRTILGFPPDSPFILDPAQQPPPYNPIYGNQTSLSFAFVYRWHSTIGQEDTKYLPGIAAQRPTIDTLNIEDGLPIQRMTRGSNGTFSDKDLAIEIRRAMRQIAGHPGALHIPPVFKETEVKAILQGRSKGLQLSTLNEYREHFHLKKYSRFEEVNNDPRVSHALKQLYASPDDIELYPGLIAEQTQDRRGGVGINDGIGLGYTTSIGILQDAVNLIRNDRFITTEYNPKRLTEFGYNLSKDPASVGVPVHNGSIMAHLLSLLNNQFHPNEPAVRDPFHVLM